MDVHKHFSKDELATIFGLDMLSCNQQLQNGSEDVMAEGGEKDDQNIFKTPVRHED